MFYKEKGNCGGVVTGLEIVADERDKGPWVPRPNLVSPEPPHSSVFFSLRYLTGSCGGGMTGLELAADEGHKGP
jgi:hypothetical protein